MRSLTKLISEERELMEQWKKFKYPGFSYHISISLLDEQKNQHFKSNFCLYLTLDNQSSSAHQKKKRKYDKNQGEKWFEFE